jgi:hypothetical protein
MRLVCLVVFFIHRQACLLGGQTTNRIFNYAADIPVVGAHVLVGRIAGETDEHVVKAIHGNAR